MKNRVIEKTFTPSITNETREKFYSGWKKAVKRSMNWVGAD
jgi:glycerol kinase